MTRTKRKKTVSFSLSSSSSSPSADTQIVVVVHHVQVFANNYKKDLWFSRGELQSFRERDLEMAKNLKCMNPKLVELKFKGESPRGLEFCTHDGLRRAANLRRTSAVAAVIWSQRVFHQSDSSSRKKKKGQRNDDAIARAYEQVCAEGVRYAIERAQADERFVNENVRLLGHNIGNSIASREMSLPLQKKQQQQQYYTMSASAISSYCQHQTTRNFPGRFVAPPSILRWRIAFQMPTALMIAAAYC